MHWYGKSQWCTFKPYSWEIVATRRIITDISSRRKLRFSEKTRRFPEKKTGKTSNASRRGFRGWTIIIWDLHIDGLRVLFRQSEFERTRSVETGGENNMHKKKYDRNFVEDHGTRLLCGYTTYIRCTICVPLVQAIRRVTVVIIFFFGLGFLAAVVKKKRIKIWNKKRNRLRRWRGWP